MIEDKGAFMTPEEVADLLKVSIYTVRRWINQQAIPAYKVGRGWRIETAEFERWLRDNRHGRDGNHAATSGIPQGRSKSL